MAWIRYQTKQVPRYMGQDLPGYSSISTPINARAGVRREARCDIPAGGRRNEGRYSWVIRLPGYES
jgi:hypothetical protein